MAALGWLVAALVVALACCCGLGWLAVRERRLRVAAEVALDSARRRADACGRSLEARDAELSALRCSLILAQQEAREAAHRAEVAAVPDQEIGAALAAALAARRLPRYGRDSVGAADSLATCDTAPDLSGLAARTSALRPGDALPAGGGGPGGAGRSLTR